MLICDRKLICTFIRVKSRNFILMFCQENLNFSILFAPLSDFNGLNYARLIGAFFVFARLQECGRGAIE